MVTFFLIHITVSQIDTISKIVFPVLSLLTTFKDANLLVRRGCAQENVRKNRRAASGLVPTGDAGHARF